MRVGESTKEIIMITKVQDKYTLEWWVTIVSILPYDDLVTVGEALCYWRTLVLLLDAGDHSKDRMDDVSMKKFSKIKKDIAYFCGGQAYS